jgi:hypothetical protein
MVAEVAQALVLLLPDNVFFMPVGVAVVMMAMELPV